MVTGGGRGIGCAWHAAVPFTGGTETFTPSTFCLGVDFQFILRIGLMASPDLLSLTALLISLKS